MIYPRPSYFRLLWGLVNLLALFYKEDIVLFVFCLVRVLAGEVWLADTDCFIDGLWRLGDSRYSRA